MSENLKTQAEPQAATATEATAVSIGNGKASSFFVKLGKGTREFFRKRLVSLKRRPQNIAMVVYIAALLVITLNQTKISDTTAEIQLSNMGLCYFASLLFSILGFVCFLNSFPKRSKPKWAMMVLFFVMLAIIVFCDIVYYTKTNQGITKRMQELSSAEAQLEFMQTKYYFYQVKNIMLVHVVLIVIAGVLTGLSPLIGKLLKKIKTSVNVEGNGEMETIEVAED